LEYVACESTGGGILILFNKIILLNSFLSVALSFNNPCFATEYSVYDHIVISQKLTVSAHRLCQDGLFIYFKSVNECNKSEIFSVCEDGLKIAPIRYVEKVYADVGGQSVTQFFQIKTKFQKRVYSLNENKKDEMIFKENADLPYCMDKEIYEPANVGNWRYADSDDEKSVIESLNNSGHTLINSPYGQMIAVKNLKSEFSDIELLNVLLKSNLKSPFCNTQVTKDNIWKMSGEYTGNGYEGFSIDGLQNISSELFVQKIYYKKLPTSSRPIKSFDFTCAQIRGI
jgi:hypothetical protein